MDHDGQAMTSLDENSFAETDWFDEFPAESPAAETGRAASSHKRSDTSSAVSLLDVMPTLQVVEAVAIIEALCADLLESDAPSVPENLDASQVLVHADGSVTAPPGACRDSAAVAAIGRLLSDLMAENDFLLLRQRVVWRALASPPEYRSLGEFLRALQYYARPNGRELVEGVFARGPQPAQTVAVQQAARDEPPQYTEPVFDVSRTDTSSSHPRHLQRGVVTACIALFFLTWALVQLHAALTLVPPVDAPKLFAIQSAMPPPPPLPARWAHSTSAARRSPTVSSEASEVAEVLPPDSAERPTAPVALMGLQMAGRIEDVVGMNQSDRFAASPPAAPPGIDSANLHVVPPRVLYPQTLNLLPFGSKSADNVLEVVVNEDGRVETARSVYDPSTLGEFNALMSGLSITKAWRFYPATLDGRPVKYRLLISLTK
jgi:hypothetical protein